jgi:hypothetical protein
VRPVRRPAAPLALALLAACATVPRAGPAFAFPGAFTATQVVTVHGERGVETLLASVWREPGRFEVAFLDPALQTPLVSARLVGDAFVEERFVDFPMPASDVEALLRDVAALYGSRDIRASGDGARVRVGRWDVATSGPGGEAGCRFPERITWRIEGRSLPWIEVRTLDVRCDSR